MFKVDFFKLLELEKEVEQDKKDLLQYGLTEEEVEGYIDFFEDNWYSHSSLNKSDIN